MKVSEHSLKPLLFIRFILYELHAQQSLTPPTAEFGRKKMLMSKGVRGGWGGTDRGLERRYEMMNLDQYILENEHSLPDSHLRQGLGDMGQFPLLYFMTQRCTKWSTLH